MRERDELRNDIARLVATNHQLRLQLQERDERLRISDYEIEHLLDDKIALGLELREARTTIEFLKGKLTPGWPDA